uniref:hypothetical protein n=1 Tax=Endozoicomonas sp. YOMI1 TaxID=2828739 RepID=UPI0021472AD6
KEQGLFFRQKALWPISNNLKKTARDAESASTSVGKLTRRFLGLAAATTGFYALSRSIQGVLKTGDQFERLAVQMEAVTGSAESAQKATQWIKDSGNWPVFRRCCRQEYESAVGLCQ